MIWKLFACLLVLKPHVADPLGNVDSYEEGNNAVEFVCKAGKLRVSFYNKGILRVQAVSGQGKFEEPEEPIVIPTAIQPNQAKVETFQEYYHVTNGNIGLIVKKNPVALAMVDEKKSIVWEESTPLDLDELTVQTLKQFPDEQYFGGGMQNGRFTHRGKQINITTSYEWNDGGNPNPAPFYMTTRGYGVFRNTFKPGYYNFTDPVTLEHEENRFDAYYFYGPNLKSILNLYTTLTGRPFMPPMYGLEMGDADCYYKTANGRPPKDTLLDSTKVAQGYVENDMPVGWMLVNDGYGCGYTRLGETNESLGSRNVTLGLWTESDLTNQPTEVGKWGVRVRKLDVAWVGDGYDFAFKACQKAYNGIQDYSDARGFVWLVEGWSGSQKCAVMWTGDQYGTWDNIRFHIPTIHGSGLSSQVYVAGDVDGIFGGSSETYIRDLQYRIFTPVFMTMSGWAKSDKQPWRRGEPGTSINRKYLKLREQLLPYIYSYSHIAYNTGLPIARSLVLEYPDDPKTWDSETTKYEYLFGEYMLIAPVYTNTTVRNGIYLPKGTWFDYWEDAAYSGSQTLNNYPAPLDKIPVFIKAGAIIPMWPPMNSFREREKNGKLLVDLYPATDTNTNSEFSLYEDDMVTRQFQNGQSAIQKLILTPISNSKTVFVASELKGSFSDKSTERPYDLKFHTKQKVKRATLRIDGSYPTDLHFESKGWITTVSLPSISTDKKFEVELEFSSYYH